MNLYLITPDFDGNEEKYLSSIANSVQKYQIKLLQFRSKNLPEGKYLELSDKVINRCHQYNCKVLLNAPLEIFHRSHGDGIHLTSLAMMSQHSRPLAKDKLLSVACHNQIQTIQAKRISADIGVLSPIFATPSSPAGRPMGWKRFSEIVKTSSLPMYALGGLDLANYPTAIGHGAFGLAAKRSLWVN